MEVLPAQVVGALTAAMELIKLLMSCVRGDSWVGGLSVDFATSVAGTELVLGCPDVCDDDATGGVNGDAISDSFDSGAA